MLIHGGSRHLLLLPPSLPPFLTWFLPKYTSSLQPQQSVVIFHGHLDLSASDRLFVGGEGGGGREGGGGGGGEEGGFKAVDDDQKIGKEGEAGGGVGSNVGEGESPRGERGRRERGSDELCAFEEEMGAELRGGHRR